RTGEIELLVDRDDRAAIGMAVDHRSRLFVAGGPTGDAFVYDARTGAELAFYDLADGETFINDVVVTREAAWLTDSFNPFLYRIPIGPGGRLASDAEQVPLGGDYQDLPGFNLNGIEATPNGRWLIAVHAAIGDLYRIDPATGEATVIDLGGDAVPNGDGILLDGKRLYVVQNFFNQIAVVDLASDLASGEIVEVIMDPRFDIPTTIAEHGHSLYAVNARFSTPPTPETEYDVVRVEKV
ncbi:MAG TPA: superoxide dismutase, partial [Actinomycetota bacterium]